MCSAGLHAASSVVVSNPCQRPIRIALWACGTWQANRFLLAATVAAHEVVVNNPWQQRWRRWRSNNPRLHKHGHPQWTKTAQVVPDSHLALCATCWLICLGLCSARSTPKAHNPGENHTFRAISKIAFCICPLWSPKIWGRLLWARKLVETVFSNQRFTKMKYS